MTLTNSFKSIKRHATNICNIKFTGRYAGMNRNMNIATIDNDKKIVTMQKDVNYPKASIMLFSRLIETLAKSGKSDRMNISNHTIIL